MYDVIQLLSSIQIGACSLREKFLKTYDFRKNILKAHKIRSHYLGLKVKQPGPDMVCVLWAVGAVRTIPAYRRINNCISAAARG